MNDVHHPDRMEEKQSECDANGGPFDLSHIASLAAGKGEGSTNGRGAVRVK
ncbi:hypothetical protein HAHE_03860 [Haloferula helveola]|uniref:Uncharacterized protein n=1 Tax=Haloferula helveola TaxID=490095 RepID=A0ABM7RCS7_9BACT|nr:hypothetical protein HAHE_03860 [Haloferula helveola]